MGDARGSIAFARVSKSFQSGAWALNEISLDIAPGTFCVILGPSGAGKSTFLGMVNGLAHPSQGSVTVNGEVLSKRALPRIRRRVAMVHQHFSLIDRLRVGQNVLAGSAAETSLWRVLWQWYPRTMRDKAAALIARVGLDPDCVGRQARTLSGGQQQRVAIARALIADPDIILADEPIASVDPRIAGDILALLRETARERGATVICSLHQPEFALAVADRIIFLRAGRVVFDGAPQDLTPAALQTLYAADQAAGVAPAQEQLSLSLGDAA